MNRDSKNSQQKECLAPPTWQQHDASSVSSSPMKIWKLPHQHGDEVAPKSEGRLCHDPTSVGMLCPDSIQFEDGLSHDASQCNLIGGTDLLFGQTEDLSMASETQFPGQVKTSPTLEEQQIAVHCNVHDVPSALVHFNLRHPILEANDFELVMSFDSAEVLMALSHSRFAAWHEQRIQPLIVTHLLRFVDNYGLSKSFKDHVSTSPLEVAYSACRRVTSG